jgi:hypothetical protein
MDCGDFHILFKSLLIIALPFNSITYAGSKKRSSKNWEALALRAEFGICLVWGMDIHLEQDWKVDWSTQLQHV